MAASYNDSYQLSQDATFKNRIQSALLTGSISVAGEAWTTPFHRERATFINNMLSSPTALSAVVSMFAGTVATDATCLSDATAGGTVALTTGNVATQAALVTDAHIMSAISAQFNAFVRAPMA